VRLLEKCTPVLSEGNKVNKGGAAAAGLEVFFSSPALSFAFCGLHEAILRTTASKRKNTEYTFNRINSLQSIVSYKNKKSMPVIIYWHRS
jgi:hypothetical protein